MKAVLAFPETRAAAERLAARLGLPCSVVEVHRFPDGESLVRVAESVGDAILYRSLDHPNDKLVELMLAVAELRRRGAAEIALIAPYLAYMRQDVAFRPGEAVSQKVVGQFLATLFDVVFTVDPHLHRTPSLSGVFGDDRGVAISAAPALVDALQRDQVAADTLLVAPDSEAAPWVARVAMPLGLDMLVAAKSRAGDRKVSIRLPADADVRGRPAILIDDVISTGVTLGKCARALYEAGASSVEALTVHCLASQADMAGLRDAGVSQVRSVDTVVHPTNAMSILPWIADAVRLHELAPA